MMMIWTIWHRFQVTCSKIDGLDIISALMGLFIVISWNGDVTVGNVDSVEVDVTCRGGWFGCRCCWESSDRIVV